MTGRRTDPCGCSYDSMGNQYLICGKHSGKPWLPGDRRRRKEDDRSRDRYPYDEPF